MPAISVFVLDIPSYGLSFVSTILNNGKITLATTTILFNIPSVGLNFYDFMPNIPSVELKFHSIIPDFRFSDHTFGMI